MKLRNFLIFYFFYKSCNKTLHSSRGPIVIWSHSQCTTEDAHVQSCIIIPIRKCSSQSWHHLCHQADPNAFLLCGGFCGITHWSGTWLEIHHTLGKYKQDISDVSSMILNTFTVGKKTTHTHTGCGLIELSYETNLKVILEKFGSYFPSVHKCTEQQKSSKVDETYARILVGR